MSANSEYCDFAPPEPVATFVSRVGWRVRHSQIIFSDPPSLIMQAVPLFAGCCDGLERWDILWNVFELVASVQKPGAYWFLTCSCGSASHAGIEERVLVSHPDPDTVVWELDIPGLRPALTEDFAQVAAGFVRLVFARAEYEADIRELLRELQCCARTPVAPDALAQDVEGRAYLREAYPALERIAVDDFEPVDDGQDLERLLALDTGAAWLRTALFPPGATVTFGFFPPGEGHDLMQINGANAERCWPTASFTRWAVLDAFRRWMTYIDRASWLKNDHRLPADIDPNEWVLRSEADRAACHQAGQSLAALMQASLQEGQVAPDVRVEYREHPLPAAIPHTTGEST